MGRCLCPNGDDWGPHVFVIVDNDGRGKYGVESLLVEDMVGGEGAFGGMGGVVLVEGSDAASCGSDFKDVDGEELFELTASHQSIHVGFDEVHNGVHLADIRGT